MDITLHQYLKDSTRQNHTAAESHPFQGALANARLSRAAYVDYLQQLRELHAAFESKLASAADHDANVGSVVRPDLYQLQFLDRDLQALGAKPAPALNCIKTFTDSDAFADPVSLLGVLYVLLGSKHGGKYIAHNIKQAFEFTDAGYTYFSPYGENFREVWQHFTSSLNELKISEPQREAVLQGASKTFDLFGEIGAQIWDRSQVAAQ